VPSFAVKDPGTRVNVLSDSGVGVAGRRMLVCNVDFVIMEFLKTKKMLITKKRSISKIIVLFDIIFV